MEIEAIKDSKISKHKLAHKQKPTALSSQHKHQEPIFQKKHPIIAVVDEYLTKQIPIDPYDEISDITHGEVVESYIKAQCPAVEITRGKVVSTNTTDEQGNMLFSPKIPLNELAESLNNKNGKKFDAVNLSMIRTSKIKDIAEITGFPLTRENLIKYKDKIRDLIKKENTYGAKIINEELEALEKITAKGIPVYVAAGNVGPEEVNIYSFAKGVTTVGALGKDKKTKTQYSADNSLVKRWEQGDYPVNEIKDSDKVTGYDINSDNKPEIFENKVSGKKSSWSFLTSNEKIIKGTSFSTPTTLGKDLRIKFGSACDQ